ncbi:hypothetical protein [Gemmatimonas sp.]|uniref:hypothetical protein n=1 Tax=Gemmatimonas sp. TaxID=1962908 RepID=UPI0035694896
MCAPAAPDYLIVIHEGEQAIGEPARGRAKQAPAHRLHGKQFPDVPDRKRVATGRDLQQYAEDHDADPCGQRLAGDGGVESFGCTEGAKNRAHGDRVGGRTERPKHEAPHRGERRVECPREYVQPSTRQARGYQLKWRLPMLVTLW